MHRIFRILASRRLFVARASLAVLGFATVAQSSGADALQYTKNYFVTGDYEVGGVGLRGKGGVDGIATGTLTMSYVPAGADIVAAILYWETEESTTKPSSSKGFFDGKAIVGDVRGDANNPACFSSAVATSTSGVCTCGWRTGRTL